MTPLRTQNLLIKQPQTHNNELKLENTLIFLDQTEIKKINILEVAA